MVVLPQTTSDRKSWRAVLTQLRRAGFVRERDRQKTRHREKGEPQVSEQVSERSITDAGAVAAVASVRPDGASAEAVAAERGRGESRAAHPVEVREPKENGGVSFRRLYRCPDCAREEGRADDIWAGLHPAEEMSYSPVGGVMSQCKQHWIKESQAKRALTMERKKQEKEQERAERAERDAQAAREDEEQALAALESGLGMRSQEGTQTPVGTRVSPGDGASTGPTDPTEIRSVEGQALLALLGQQEEELRRADHLLREVSDRVHQVQADLRGLRAQDEDVTALSQQLSVLTQQLAALTQRVSLSDDQAGKSARAHQQEHLDLGRDLAGLSGQIRALGEDLARARKQVDGLVETTDVQAAMLRATSQARVQYEARLSEISSALGEGRSARNELEMATRAAIADIEERIMALEQQGPTTVIAQGALDEGAVLRLETVADAFITQLRALSDIDETLSPLVLRAARAAAASEFADAFVRSFGAVSAAATPRTSALPSVEAAADDRDPEDEGLPIADVADVWTPDRSYEIAASGPLVRGGDDAP
jgi:hypothetical protein